MAFPAAAVFAGLGIATGLFSASSRYSYARSYARARKVNVSQSWKRYNLYPGAFGAAVAGAGRFVGYDLYR